MSGRGKGGKVTLKKNYFELRVTDNDLYGRVLAKVVLSVIVKSSVTTSRVSQNPPFAASLVVVV
jgi:hypothetical protein